MRSLSTTNQPRRTAGHRTFCRLDGTGRLTVCTARDGGHGISEAAAVHVLKPF